MQLDKDGLDDIAAILVSEFTYCGRTKRVWLLRFVGMYVNFEPEAREKSLYGFRRVIPFHLLETKPLKCQISIRRSCWAYKYLSRTFFFFSTKITCIK